MEEDTGQETSSQLGGGPPAGGPVDLIEESSLTYFIPQATSFNIEEEFANANAKGPYEGVFKSIEQRESLFFGKSVPQPPFPPLSPPFPPFSPFSPFSPSLFPSPP